MGNHIVFTGLTNCHLKDHQAFAELENGAVRFQRSHLGLAHEIDIQISGDRQSHASDMGQRTGIAAHIGQGKQTRAGYRAAGAQMALVGL